MGRPVAAIAPTDPREKQAREITSDGPIEFVNAFRPLAFNSRCLWRR
jgi:hypothetical protein